MDVLLPGQILGSFRIVRQLGAGGMGTVYEAEHLRLPVRRALKVFSSESVHVALLRKRFLAEGKILSSLQHPRIVRVYDLIVDDETGLAYFEMDLVSSPDGEPRTLAQAHERGVGEDEIRTWFEDVCEGLAYIHSKGVIHRDISADNILIGPDGHAVISDFGIAKIVDEEYRKKIDVTVTMVTPNGVEFRMGKERYMSPELKAKNGKASFASDAWALGVTFFWMLSGSWYDVGTRLEDALAIFDYDWATVIAQLCNKNPPDRLPEGGVRDVSKLLRKRVCDIPIWRRKWVQIAGTVIVLLAALLAVLLNKADDAKKEPVKPPRTTAEILKGAESGNVEDMVLAADLYRDGHFVETNYARSVELYRKAVEAGSFDAIARLGTMYECGLGVANDQEAAFLMYVIAAGTGQLSNSVQDVIRCYEDGIGVARNTAAALNWRRRLMLQPITEKRSELLVKFEADGDRALLQNERNLLSRQTFVSKCSGVDLHYVVCSNGTVEISGYFDELGRLKPAISPSTMGRLILPERIEGCCVAAIGPYAFNGCTNLTELTLSCGIEQVGFAAFSECPKLAVHVPIENRHLAMCGDTLYSSDYMTLISYIGTNAEVTVDLRTKSIGRGAFAYCRDIRKLVLPEGLERINPMSVVSCDNVSSIVMPSTVRYIGANAFVGCYNFSSVFYRGRKPVVDEEVYGGHEIIFSFVTKQAGWENASGVLPLTWPETWGEANAVLDKRERFRRCWPILYWDGIATPKRDELLQICAKEMERQADHGNVSAMSYLGARYRTGWGGVKRNGEKAYKYLLGAASSGNVEDMGKIGVLYRDGVTGGVKGRPDYAEAIKWFMRAISDGGRWGVWVCQELAPMYRDGKGVDRNPEVAFLLYLVAASHNMVWAQCEVANCYMNGIGTNRDLNGARKWFNRAATWRRRENNPDYGWRLKGAVEYAERKLKEIGGVSMEKSRRR